MAMLEKFSLKELKIFHGLCIGSIIIFIITIIYSLLLKDWAEVINAAGWLLIFSSFIKILQRTIKSFSVF